MLVFKKGQTVRFLEDEHTYAGVVKKVETKTDASIIWLANTRNVETDEYKFYESLNKVVLCPEDEDGYLPPKYFQKVTIQSSELCYSSKGFEVLPPP